MGQIKLGFWDVFNYFLNGVTIIILFFFLAPVDNALYERIRILDHSLVVLMIPFIAFILGMLLEPVANLFYTLVKQIPLLGINKKARGVEAIESFLMSDNIFKLTDRSLRDINIYRVCKAVVEQNCPSHNISTFLSRFGFYRSQAFLMFGLGVWFFVQVSVSAYSCKYLFLVIALWGLSYLFLKRASMFYGHMEYEIYYNYAAYFMLKD